MHKTTLFFSLIATGAMITAGCDRGDQPSTAIGGNAKGLVGDEAPATTSTTAQLGAPETGIGLPSGGDPTPIIDDADETSADEGPEGETGPDDSEVDPYPIAAAWTDGAALAPQGSLSFTVTNVTTDQNVAFTVSVVSRSLLGDGEKPLGDLVLGPGESEAFTFGAANLPVRSDEVVSQMAVGLRRKDASSDWVGRRHLEAERFYRHEVGLGSVRAYTEEALMSELGGVLYQSDLPATEMSASALEAEVLGYKDDESGTAQPVSLAETGLVSYDESGNVTGVTTGVGIGEGDASGEGAISVPEEDPTEDGPGEDEMEVADE